MKTRRGNSYPVTGAPTTTTRKKTKLSHTNYNPFDTLPDDIVLSIFVKLASSAECPADFMSTLLTCKRFNGLGVNPFVLSKGSTEMFAVKSGKWSPFVNRFLCGCSNAGNADANYILGMIQFYCFKNRRNGAALIARAAIRSHAPALYSLAIIQFNGSSGSNKNEKDLLAGVTLCARAAYLGHVDALRELGHCLKDGYGITKNITAGQRFLLEANAREIHALRSKCGTDRVNLHPCNRFLTGWFTGRVLDPGLRICGYGGCGRVETRVHEFRRCSVCGVMNYCSRGCQARDWAMGHSKSCRPLVNVANIYAVERLNV